MKLTEMAPNPILRTNGVSDGVRRAFGVATSRKTFKILSKSIYKYHVRAIIREISTNAIDGHILAGHTDMFDVYLPTELDLRFIVRDYGTGLTPEQVMDVFTVYFESTKTESNDFIGALGLGSKSPFSYTDTFSVESITDGMKRGYVAYIDNGEPFIDPTYEEETEEPNGVIITVPVQKKDVALWREEAKRVYEPFNGIRPNIVGEDFKISYQPTKLDEYGMINYQSSYYSGVYALMGNIMYPIDADFYESTLFSCFRGTKNVTVIPFDLGSLDFMPSREELSLDAPTKAALNAKIAVASKKRFVWLENEFNKNKTIRAKVAFYHGLSHGLQQFLCRNKEFYINGESIYEPHRIMYECDGSENSPYKQEYAGFWANRSFAKRTTYLRIDSSRYSKNRYENQTKQNISRLLQPNQQRKLYLIHMDTNKITHTLSGYCTLNKLPSQTNFVQYYGSKDEPRIARLIKDGMFDESEIICLKASEMVEEVALYARNSPEPKEREKRPTSPTVYRYFVNERGFITCESLKMTKKEFVQLEGMAYIKYVDEAQNLKGRSAAFHHPWAFNGGVNQFELLGITEFYMLRSCMAKWLPETKLKCMDTALCDITINAIKKLKPNHYQANKTANKSVKSLLSINVDLCKLVGNKPTANFHFAKSLVEIINNKQVTDKLENAIATFYNGCDDMNVKYREAFDKFEILNPALGVIVDLMDRRFVVLDKPQAENFIKLIKWK